MIKEDNGPWQFEDYKIVKGTYSNGRITYMIYFANNIDPVSEHPTKTFAVRAVNRYKKADERKK